MTARAAPDASSVPPEGRARASLVDAALAAVLVPLAAAAWAALISAHAGQLSVALCAAAGALAAAAVLAAAVVGRCRGGGLDASAWDVAALALAVVCVWRLLPAVTPWPAFLDASWYVNTAAAIAAEGGLRFRPPVLHVPAEAGPALVTTLADQREAGMAVPADAGRGFHNVLYAVPDAGRAEAVPYHPPLFASWMAAWGRARSIGGAGEALLAWSLAYLLAVGALARRLFGPAAGVAALALVGLGPAFAYFGRTPFAEVPAGALLVAGLAGLGALAAGPPRPLVAAAAGAALGLAALTKLDVLPAVGAALAWWLASRARSGGAREALGLGAGLALPAIHAALLAVGVSRLYVALNGGGVLALARGALPWLALGGLVVAALAAAAWWGARGRGRRPGVRVVRRVAAGVAVALLAAAAVAAALAPEGTPPSMVRLLLWILSPLGVWAAAAGLLLAMERPARAGPVLAVALLAVPLVLLEPAVTRSLSPLYAARRLVPYALPVAAVLAAGLVPWVLAARLERAGDGVEAGGRAPAASWRAAGARWPQAAALAAAALIAVNLIATARPLLAWGEFGGGPLLARRIAAMGGPRDVFLFSSVLGGGDAGRLAAMVGNLEGRWTAVLASPRQADRAAAAVAAWREEGRRVFVVADDYEAVPGVAGFEAMYVDEAGVVPSVLAPSPYLPPRWVPYELTVLVMELVPYTAP